MADELERVRKALRELGKSLQSLNGDFAPKDVHKLRTASRRVEAIAGVLGATDRKKSRRLVESIEPVRKAAGGVRDMDVLLADTRKLARYAHGESLTHLVAHLKIVRQQNAEELQHALHHRHKAVLRGYQGVFQVCLVRFEARKIGLALRRRFKPKPGNHS